MSFNRVDLIGNLGADPEARSFNNGGEVVNLRVATSESWKDKDGQRQERTEWHNVSIFGEGLCRVAKQYLKKGSKAFFSGQLRTRKWQDQSGNDRYSTEVVLQGPNAILRLLDSRADSGGGSSRGGNDGGYGGGDGGSGSSGGSYNGGTSGERPRPAAFDTDLDDDVPF